METVTYGWLCRFVHVLEVSRLPESPPLSDRVLQLEELVSHQEHLVQQVNEVVVQLRAEVARLDLKLTEQQARLTWLAEDPSGDATLGEEKPPHY